MAFVNGVTNAPRNRLLAALPPEDFNRLRPRLDVVQLPGRATLYAPGEPITAVHFIETGYVSMLSYLSSGDAIEVGGVGPEGITGLPVLFGDDSDTCEAVMNGPGPGPGPGPGTALRMDAGLFCAELDRTPAFRSLLMRTALYQHRQVARMAACNGRHSTDQRLARWLLTAQDRSGGGPFPMTHELLATMLGVRRAGVTVAAGLFQRAGLIHYGRGHIQVTDRTGLEARACECYGLARQALDQLFGAKGQPQALSCH
ncbi:Crp/Fnr family transcriptional regulator [Belnapia sp. T6]|uniref:Crp/Fnr family transcriptional regulator n=1 Tax=Belnapia mucosa TaxID=2804532 RepID=A0ABS1UWW5_9PROT|nr:Crp/Fnr family transcriptional regulator [Belnapia mucosa]MBL6453954.1 Crp/Fnr family transcriptional regulator [Belnapia mucosa]